jgi:hypothetical protein
MSNIKTPFMKHLPYLVILVFLISCGTGSNDEGQTEKDDKRLINEMLTDRFNSFQSSSDPLEQAQIYVKDVSNNATWMPQNDELIRGKNNIKKWAEWFFSTYKLVLDPNKQYFEEPVIDGAIAYRRFTSVGYYIKISTGDSIGFDQKYIDTFKRINGNWKITTHMWSSNDLGESIWNLKTNLNETGHSK